MQKNRHIKPVFPDRRRGWFHLPSEEAMLCLTPIESTLYRLFLAHPEGLLADDLVLYWDELWDIYAQESRFDDPELRVDVLMSLSAPNPSVSSTPT